VIAAGVHHAFRSRHEHPLGNPEVAICIGPEPRADV
jgi:hypothetical protein